MTRLLPILLLCVFTGCVTKQPARMRPVVVGVPGLPPVPDAPIILPSIAPQPPVKVKLQPFRFPVGINPYQYTWCMYRMPDRYLVQICDGDAEVVGTNQCWYYLRGFKNGTNAIANIPAYDR